MKSRFFAGNAATITALGNGPTISNAANASDINYTQDPDPSPNEKATKKTLIPPALIDGLTATFSKPEEEETEEDKEDVLDQLNILRKSFKVKSLQLDKEFAYWEKIKLATMFQDDVEEEADPIIHKTFMEKVTGFL